MKPFEIYITYISWGSGGKSRPVLVARIDNRIVSALMITTQYANKSKSIQSQYFKIENWLQSGLHKQSYIDTGSVLSIPEAALTGKTPLGTLTDQDKKRLIVFLQNRKKTK